MAKRRSWFCKNTLKKGDIVSGVVIKFNKHGALVSIKQGVVTIEYLDRRPDEALAAEPTVLISRQFTYRAGEFEER